MSMSIDERFGAEPLRCDDCGAPHPDHTQYCPSVVVGTREQDRQDQQLARAIESAREAQRDACLRGFAIVHAAFEAWRAGDNGVPTDDTDVFLALQATHLGFQALARALEKK